MSDEHDPPVSPEDPLRLLRTLVDRVMETSQAVLTASARRTPDFIGGPLADYVEAITGLTERLTGPLEDILEEQRRLAERMADWADQHRRLSEEIATWAERNRQMTGQMQRLLRPALAQAVRMSEVTREYVDELRR